MTLGRGLESLIPQNANQNSGGVSVPQDPVLGTGQGEVVLESTVAPIVNPAPVVSVPISTPIDGEVKNLPSEDNRPQYRPDDDDARRSTAVFQIEVDKIEPNPFQPRRDFNEEELRELAQSVREYGVIQPLIVTKIEEEREYGTQVRYQLIAGERRLRAAKMAGLERVPVIIKHVGTKKLNLELAIIENVQRSDLSPLDEAKAYSRLQDEFNLTQREIAVRVSKSRESVANTLRLLSLPSLMQDALKDGKINESQARVLLSVADLTEQQSLFYKIMEERMSVRQLKRKASGGPDPEKNYLERQLEEKLGAPVEIKNRDGKGKLVIKFFSDEEMRGVLERLLGDVG